MKKAILLLVFSQLSFLFSANAQNVSWAYNIGNTGSDQGYDISNDELGNVYVTGWFSGTAQFGNQTLVSYGLQDIFIASYDSNGNLNWVRQAGSSENEVSAGIASAPNGDTYITGWFKGSCDFSDSTVISQGDYDMFLAKYNAEGAIQWVHSGGGTLDDYGNRVTLTSDGGATVAGSFKSTFSAAAIQTASQGNRDILVCHYAPDGQLVWMKGIGGVSEDRAYGIVQDTNGDYYITGVFSDVVDFGGTSLTCNSFFATYLAKLSNDGNVVWAIKGDGFANDFVRGYGVAVDQQGNVYTNGFYSGRLNMGGVTLLASGGQYDQETYLMKFTSDGTLVWSRTSGGALGVDQSTDLLLAPNNQIMEVGFFHNAATFGSATINAAGQSDVFVTKYDDAGNLLAVSSFGGSGNEYGYGIAADNDGNIYMAGVITGSTNMGTIPLESNGGNDILIARLTLSPLEVSNSAALAPISLYPNPTRDRIQLDCSALKQLHSSVNLEIVDQSGRTVYSERGIAGLNLFDLSDLQSGLYLVRLFGEGYSSTTQLLVAR